jgi:hypothetical protein
VVEEANALGTTYLRTQTLAEPVRTGSLTRLVRYTETSIRLSQSVPGSPAARQAVADGQQLQRELWALAGQALALDAAPTASARRLYVESLNQLIDLQTVRVAGLNNRVPGPVLALEVAGAVVALSLLAFYLAILGRGVLAVLLAATLVTLLLLVTFDLDRPTRGLIRIPSTALTDLRASMAQPRRRPVRPTLNNWQPASRRPAPAAESPALVPVECLERLVEVVPHRQGDLGGGRDHAGEPADRCHRDQGPDNVLGGCTRVQGRFGGPVAGSEGRTHGHQPTKPNQGPGSWGLALERRCR